MLLVSVLASVVCWASSAAWAAASLPEAILSLATLATLALWALAYFFSWAFQNLIDCFIPAWHCLAVVGPPLWAAAECVKATRLTSSAARRASAPRLDRIREVVITEVIDTPT